MTSPVWVITGFKIETFDSSVSCVNTVPPDRIVGRPTDTTKTIMRGGTNFRDDGNPERYTYLHGYFERMEDYDNLPLAERGLGAVSGGFISRASTPFTWKGTHEQEWGAIDGPETQILCLLYHSTFRTFNDIIVCFDRTNVAPISGCWLDARSMTGLNSNSDITDWMSSPDAGSSPPFLEKGKLWLAVYLG